MLLVVGPGHSWVGHDRVTAAELMAADWVLREPGSGTRSVFEAQWDRLGLGPQLRVLLELPSNEAVRAAVEAGAGATVISASVAAPSLEAGLLHRVGLSLPDRSFELLRHRGRNSSRAAQALMQVMDQATGMGRSKR